MLKVQKQPSEIKPELLLSEKSKQEDIYQNDIHAGGCLQVCPHCWEYCILSGGHWGYHMCSNGHTW